MIIFHLTPFASWNDAKQKGIYTADSLTTQGFIHASRAGQLASTANRHYTGQHGLVILAIDTSHLVPELRWENTEGGAELFPHLYGPLNLDAVMNVFGFEPEADGLFKSPPGLVEYAEANLQPGEIPASLPATQPVKAKPVTSKPQTKSIFPILTLLGAALILFTLGCVVFLLEWMRPSLLQYYRIDSADLGLAIAAQMLTFIITLPLSGWLGDRFGCRKFLAGGIVAIIAGTFITVYGQSSAGMSAGLLLVGLGEGLILPAVLNLALEQVRPIGFVAGFAALGLALMNLPGSLLHDSFTAWMLALNNAVAVGLIATIGLGIGGALVLVGYLYGKQKEANPVTTHRGSLATLILVLVALFFAGSITAIINARLVDTVFQQFQFSSDQVNQVIYMAVGIAWLVTIVFGFIADGLQILLNKKNIAWGRLAVACLAAIATALGLGLMVVSTDADSRAYALTLLLSGQSTLTVTALAILLDNQDWAFPGLMTGSTIAAGLLGNFGMLLFLSIMPDAFTAYIYGIDTSLACGLLAMAIMVVTVLLNAIKTQKKQGEAQ